MTPEELREKVARALFRSAVDDGGHINGFLPYNQQPEATQRHYECLADAAISVVREAMREPSGTLLHAMDVALGTDTAEVTIKDIPRIVRLNDAYLAMLSHSALAEPKP